jgi:TetR/AcrR family transcriptional regulator, cholesterol catabolism regulator
MEKRLRKPITIGKAAARQFNKKGYLETNMDHIAAAAKMSKGGVYHYFSSKDEILHFILSNYMDLILNDLESELKMIEGSSQRIQFIITRHIDLYTGNPAEAKTLLHEAHCLPAKYYKKIALKQRKYYQIVANAITDLLGGRAEIDKPHITSLTFLLFGMCNWIYSWYDPKGHISSKGLSEMIWTVFLKGVTEYRAQE